MALPIPDGTEFWWDRFLVGQSVAKRLNNASGQRLCFSTLLSLISIDRMYEKLLIGISFSYNAIKRLNRQRDQG